MYRLGSTILTRAAAVAVTVWLFINYSVYIADETYRTGLWWSWRIRHGEPDLRPVFSPQQMVEIHAMQKSDYLGDRVDIQGNAEWIEIEQDLEAALISMFERTDKVKGWEIKKMSSEVWPEVGQKLKKLSLDPHSRSPAIDAPEDVDMTNVLVYNRVPKAGSTLLMNILYKLREKLGYLVIRGKYHSYRYFRDHDRKGLGHFLEQASSRARLVYIQHQYYINYTEFHIDQPRYINMVRDPLEQFISWYYYKRMTVLYNRSPHNMTSDELRIMSQSLTECIVERRLECVYYGYTAPRNKTNQLDFRRRWNPDFFHPDDLMLYFCGHEAECSSLGSPLALQRAKLNVEQHFAVVGVLEHLQESAAVLQHYLPQYFTGIVDLLKDEGEMDQSTLKAEHLYTEARGAMRTNQNSLKAEHLSTEARGDMRTNQNTLKSEHLSTEVRETMRTRLKDLYELYDFIKQKLFRQYAEIKQ